MTPAEVLERHTLLVDIIVNALDAIKLVDNAMAGMDPAEVKAAIATAMLRCADAPTVTH